MTWALHNSVRQLHSAGGECQIFLPLLAEAQRGKGNKGEDLLQYRPPTLECCEGPPLPNKSSKHQMYGNIWSNPYLVNVLEWMLNVAEEEIGQTSQERIQSRNFPVNKYRERINDLMEQVIRRCVCNNEA